MSNRFFGIALLCAMFWAGQALAQVNGEAILGKRPPRELSAFGFFSDMAAQEPVDGVVPYVISAPLFTDYAEKRRFIYTPEPVAYRTGGPLEFPVGSALIKTFHYGDNLVETRVLLHQENGWKAYPYVWNEDQTEAKLKIAGADLAVEMFKGEINYRVPNANQCKACHVDNDGEFLPLGPKIRNLNFDGQLERLIVAGVLLDAPADAPSTPDYRDKAEPLNNRARAYLDANCGHCHQPGKPADTSGLFLHWEEDRDIHLGINKRPVAAGRGSGGLEFDIVPGDPDASILVYRMDSTDPAIMMPEVGRGLIDEAGLALIREWIEGL